MPEVHRVSHQQSQEMPPPLFRTLERSRWTIVLFTKLVFCPVVLGKQLALVKTNSAVRTCGFDFGGNIIMFSTDKQMGYQCFVNFFDLRDSSQIGETFRKGSKN